MKTSRLLGALAAMSFLIFTGTAHADVIAPSGGKSGVGGTSAAGGATSAAGGTTSTATTSSSGAETGGTSAVGSSATGNAKPNDDDGGCSIGTTHNASGLAIGLLGVALAFGLRQARRRN